MLTGSDKGKVGKITLSMPKVGKVIVDGVNIKKVTLKKKSKDAKGSIIEKAYPINASNVALKK